MAINRSREVEHFPTITMTRKNFLDVDDSIAEIINGIKTLQMEGKYKDAATLIQRHADMLEPYILTVEDLNYWDEETLQIEKYVLGINAETPKAQAIFYQSVEPDKATVKLYDVWI